MSLIDKFKTDFSKFFNDRERRGDSIENQLEKSSLSINLFSTEATLLTQLQNSLDISSNLTFSTSPIEIPENNIGGFSSSPLLDLPIDSVNQSFSSSPLEESPTEEIGSVDFFQNPHGADENGVGGFNIDGFTQFMVSSDTLYPGEGLNNSGIVNHFPNPHNYDGDTIFEIEGFTANMQKYETLYPSKDTLEISGINSFIVDHFRTPHGIGHFGGSDNPHDIPGFVPNVQPLSDGFYPNTIELGSVDFFPGGPFTDNSNYASGFTENMEPFGGNKLTTQYDINTFYTDNPLMNFDVTSGKPSPGLSMYSAGLESQFTSVAEAVDGDVTWNLQIPAAGLAGTEPPYDRDKLIGSLESWNIETGIQYKGEVNFFSDTTSYATGFTEKMYFKGNSKKDSQYDIDTFYTDEVMNFTGVTSGIPNPSVTTYAISDSIFVGTVGEVENQFSVYTLGDFQPGNIAGMSPRTTINPEGISETRVPFTFDELKIDMSSWNVDGFNIEDFTSFGDNVAGYTKGNYSTENSNFVFTDAGDNLKLQLNTSTNIFSQQSYSANTIPSLVSVPRPDNSVSSGPFEVDSGFQLGDFTLNTTKYLQNGARTDAVEGNIVRSVDGSPLNDLRVNGTTLSDKFDDGKGTKYRDLSNMDVHDYLNAPPGYTDGLSSTRDGTYGSYGLIDRSINEVKAGLTPDFFIRESGGGRFLGRIVKDLKRTLQRTLSPAGILGLGKDVVMTLFNASEKSIYTNLLTRYTAGNLGQFGIRGSSIASNVLGLARNSFAGVPDDSMALYERRVDSKHPATAGSFGAAAAAAAAEFVGGTDRPVRTLTTRYGQPKYPVHRALSKPATAHELYSGGMLKRGETRADTSFDKINIVSYGQGPGGVDNSKDLIKFNIRDVRNQKYIVLRAFLTNIQDSISPEWNNYRYVGRPDDVYVYKGTTRSVSFSLKVAAFSRREMIPMWEKINYLVGLNYGSFVDTSLYANNDGGYYQGNPGMSSPICELTIGDYLTSQPGYIKDFNISVPPEYPWDVIIDDGGSNVIGELPQMVDINMGFQVIPQQIPDSYGKHFGKVGLGTDKVSSGGLPWLNDLYNSSKNALSTFDTAHESYMKDKKIKPSTGEVKSVANILNSDSAKEKVNTGT